jgi:lipid II:glycine glycyltransferase (peptidoglycan interpeptide bridge formation enzyme)
MKADIIIQNITESEKLNWNASVNHPLQTWQWGDFRASQGVKVERLGVFQNHKLISGWQITFHKIPHTPWTIGYFPKGPQPEPVMIDKIRETGYKNHALYIQLEPNITIHNSLFHIPDSLRPSHHPLFTKYTFMMDLTKSEDQLLAAMHPKTRYNLKIAQKHQVVIKEDNSPQAFREYLRLSQETTKRQQFYAHNENYQRKMWETMHPTGIARLWTATVDQEVIATWILFYWQDTVYYPYGASSRNKRETMAPNLLLWEIAKDAKKKGYRKFDLWGAMGPNPDENNPWYGFHRFKQGYNPELIEFAGSFDLIINPVAYRLYCFADDIRWKILNHKK